MQTTDLTTLARSAAARAAAEIELASGGLDELASNLRSSGRDPENHRELGACMQWFGRLLELIQTLGLAQPIPAHALAQERSALLEQSRAFLEEFIEAQRLQDHLLLADLAQHALKPLLRERIAPLLALFASQP